MSVRRSTISSVLVVLVVEGTGFVGGAWLTSQQRAEHDSRLDALRAEFGRRLDVLDELRHAMPAGTAGQTGVEVVVASIDVEQQAAIVDTVKKELQNEMGLVPVQLLATGETVSSNSTPTIPTAPVPMGPPGTSEMASSSR